MSDSSKFPEKIGAYEAKTHFSSLLDAVEEGAEIVITRKGIPVAALVPYQEEKRSIEDTIEALFELRRTITLGSLSIRDMREEGRRF